MVTDMHVNTIEHSNGSRVKHLDSLEIIGFRAFDHLKIERLGGVNLIVGKNSVGKSCLLEALRLYAEQGSPRLLWQLLSERDEEYDIGWRTTAIDDKFTPFLRIEHLFHKAQNLEEITQEIEIGSLQSSHNRLSIMVGQLDELQKKPKFQQVSKSVQAPTSRFPDELGIRIVFNNEIQDLLPLDHDDFFRLSNREWRKNLGKIRSVFVGTQGLSITELDRYWDQIKLSDSKKKVVDALKLIIPEIKDVDIFGIVEQQRDKIVNSRVIKVRLQDRQEPVPLRSLGEGLTRVFGLIVAIVNASDGLFLVDEIESGLHYTVQCNLWRLIFQTARQLNVQVFATTHSWDCIDAFQKAALEDENEEGILIRLQRRGNEIIPTLFDEQRLSIITQEQIEVR